MSWSSEGYDAGAVHLIGLSTQTCIWLFVYFLFDSTFFPSDYNLICYRLPWQCQDFLSGQEIGRGRK